MPCTPGVAFSIQTSIFVPPEGSSVKTALPVTFEPLRDSIAALAVAASAAAAGGRPARIAPSAPATRAIPADTASLPIRLIASSLCLCLWMSKTVIILASKTL